MNRLTTFVLLMALFPAICFAQGSNEIGVPDGVITASSDGHISVALVPTTGSGSIDWSMYDLIHDPAIRKELEITDSQLAAIKANHVELQQLIDLEVGTFPEAEFTKAKAAEIAMATMKIRGKARDFMRSELLPHQTERLKELSIKHVVDDRNFVDILLSPMVSEPVAITEQQADEIRTRNVQLKKKLDEGIAKLRKEYREDVIQPLTNSQEKEVVQFFGEDFFSINKGELKRTQNGR